MAVIKVSAGGGNWNSTGTWVGGVVPTTSDSIAADATSGNLTVNLNVSVQFANFSGYTGTLTINSTNTLTLTLASSTTTFGSGMAYSFAGAGATQGRIVKGNVAMTFIMLGTTPIPHFSNTGSATLTAGSDLYISNLYNTSLLRITGNNVYISGDFINGADRGFNGSTIYHMVGTGTISGILGGANSVDGNLTINTAGTITLGNPGIRLGNGNTTSNITFRHLSGTIVNPIFNTILQQSPSINTIDLISGTTWDFFQRYNATNSINLIFSGTPEFDKFVVEQNQSAVLQNFTINGADVVMNELNLLLSIVDVSFTKTSLDFIITPGCDVTVNSFIDLNGGSNEQSAAQTPPLEVRSSIPGTQSTLNVNTFSQFVSRTRFTDINCSGGNTLYGQDLTLSNTTNITQYTLPPSSGGTSQTAYTFAS